MQTSVVAPDCGLAPHPLSGKTILVTGGTGSFGHAFTRRALDSGAAKVVVFSRDEAKQAAMEAGFNDPRLRFIVGDVASGDPRPLMDAMRGVHVVAHGAAMKRVEVCARNPREAHRVNVLGTIHVADAARACGVEKAIFLSTDKAAAANTLYGMTKADAERQWNGSNVYSAGQATRFAATRYGNVIGSRGSVVPLWQAQAKVGAITLTDADCSRFWMPMSAAVDLVCLAFERMRGGETFVPKLQAAGVLSLAKAVAPDARVVETGLRPEEKLHEVLITAEEARLTYDCGDVYVIEPPERTWGAVLPLNYPKVPAGFEFTSRNAPSLTAEQIEQLVAA